ncbi:MAG: hypothetical protein ABF289_08160 [Clostridiales bacterium]
MKINEYESDGNDTLMKVYKKDGSSINAIIDTVDLNKVLEKGIWFARWHKDFNNFLVQTFSEIEIAGKKKKEKISLQSFLLGVHTKVPIKHINGNTLDNRKVNLEVYKQDSFNDYNELNENTIAIILRDKFGRENGKALIDKEDLDRVIETDYCWVSYKTNNKIFAVANTKNGRIYLNEFIMKVPKNTKIHAINLNNLDNRKSNLENKNTSDNEIEK